MSYSFSIDAPGMMPDVSWRIVLSFIIHSRLHLQEVDDCGFPETLVRLLLDEALTPFRRTAGDELSAIYALQGPCEAKLTIAGRVENPVGSHLRTRVCLHSPHPDHGACEMDEAHEGADRLLAG